MKLQTISLILLTLGLLLLPLEASIASAPGVPEGWSDGYAYANGARLHYYRAVPAPEKPVIVMVHGVTDNGLCWTNLALELQDDYDIYMLDTRSHGLSDPISATDDGDTLIKDVVEFTEVMGIGKPILMGHSMGGATVIRVGGEYPELASAVIVLDAGIGGPGAGRGRGRRGSAERGESPPRGGRAPNAERNRPSQTQPSESSGPDNLSVNMFGSPESLVAQNNYSFEDLVATSQRRHPKWDIVDHQAWALSKKQYHGAYTPEMFAVMSGSMRTGDSLAKIPVPVLILKADASPEAREAHQETVAEMPKVKLVHIDNAGHNLHHDQLDRTVEVLTEFLSTLQNKQ
ncbi:alpha/beta hydrolase [Aeoliella sp. ICT_H6.2]|uniref:Alpha/beta hydrolase n=1 Tax=Aeoliella straminimaris TaxID=2954799 RepID=A0A9X2F7Z4_9BACT|nr:alpha/beta hydrolase [Aeoliella straminimaris]MCO6044042.1 alpha/beta hydrolase [Aeoliella straminimaris]